MLIKRKSEEKRHTTGLEELDKVLGGGLPKPISVALSGPTGVGKTLFSLNFVYAGALKGEKSLFMAMEDSYNKVIRMGRMFFPNFDEFVENRNIVILDFPPNEIEQIISASNPLASLIEEYDVNRVVLDSFYPIAVSFDSEKERAWAVINMLLNMDKWDTLNLIITEDASGPTRFGLEQHTDGWIEMFESRGKIKLAVRKMRYVSFFRKTVDFNLPSY